MRQELNKFVLPARGTTRLRAFVVKLGWRRSFPQAVTRVTVELGLFRRVDSVEMRLGAQEERTVCDGG